MENISSEIKLLEKKVEDLSEMIEELTVLIHKLVSGLDQSDDIINSANTKLQEIENIIEEIEKENESKNQELIAQTVILMQQKSEIAEDVDSKYVECENNMKSCKKIENIIHTSREMINRQKLLLQMGQQEVN